MSTITEMGKAIRKVGKAKTNEAAISSADEFMTELENRETQRVGEANLREDRLVKSVRNELSNIRWLLGIGLTVIVIAIALTR